MQCQRKGAIESNTGDSAATDLYISSAAHIYYHVPMSLLFSTELVVREP